ncbi:saccharopine dehydrogenase [Niabella ginsenosidivorans]|uniref:Saccharopine dehydrogenase n=1 Tax=Niabella ginsenosidivorans TaxID=1176587 RepID=A0A1A9I7R9_9BACT|nr:saccharopine dehydrogenase C-terminal domain-containing protein [Niabella ginsenosidivorans]ANH83728.1 saccharopine dehydrogenase [Niabella ginsenosidivorans]
MKTILLFGAGKSATVLIQYFLQYAEEEKWELIVADADFLLAQSKINGHPAGKAVAVDLADTATIHELVARASVVISMLPPAFHIIIARSCLALKKNFLTASYIDEALLLLREDIKKNGLLFLGEMGLDPGLDHMSAMRIFDRIRYAGGEINSFKSHCGGLVAPEDDNNPWHYKVSWNPRNITLAGSAGAVYKEDNITKHLLYTEVFENCPVIEVPPLGKWACYPNRNSLQYIPIYQLENAKTVVRCTLRHPDFCTGWQYIVAAGLTNLLDTGIIEGFKDKSINDWFTACLNFYTKTETFDDYLKRHVTPLHQLLVKRLFEYLGLFSQERIPSSAKSSADVLQYLLETRLALSPEDKDMIIMIHEITFTLNNRTEQLFSSLIVKGDNALQTAMAKTVGLPLAIATRLLLNGAIKINGLHIPIVKEIYDPVLTALEPEGIRFYEEVYV